MRKSAKRHIRRNNLSSSLRLLLGCAILVLGYKFCGRQIIKPGYTRNVGGGVVCHVSIPDNSGRYIMYIHLYILTMHLKREGEYSRQNNHSLVTWLWEPRGHVTSRGGVTSFGSSLHLYSVEAQVIRHVTVKRIFIVIDNYKLCIVLFSFFKLNQFFLVILYVIAC